MERLYLTSTYTDERKLLKTGEELAVLNPDGEFHTSICYFDESMVVHMQEHGGSTAGYSGPAYGDNFVIDIDVKNDMQTATRVWIQIYEFLTRRGITSDNFYSGMKGYHIYIPKHFVEYPEELNNKWHIAMLVFAKFLTESIDGIKDYIDWQLYTKIHNIRYPYSVHPGSRNRKTSFLFNEIMYTQDEQIDLNRTLLWNPQDKDLIKRRIFDYSHVPDEDWVPPIDITDYYEEAKREPERIQPQTGHTLDLPNLFGEKLCMHQMKKDRNVEGSPGRSNVALRLVTWWKERGDTFEETASNLRIWNAQLPTPLSDNVSNPELDKSLQAYHKEYKFTCNDSIKMRYWTSSC